MSERPRKMCPKCGCISIDKKQGKCNVKSIPEEFRQKVHYVCLKCDYRFYDPATGYVKIPASMMPVAPVARKYKHINHEKAMDAYNEGLSDHAIAGELGNAVAGIRTWRRRNGLKSNYLAGGYKNE
jgi:hypothetical protein